MSLSILDSAKQQLFRTAGYWSKGAVEDAIVVAGTPRSGTTWLMETLRTFPGYKAFNEPLGPEKARRDHGFTWRTYLEPDDSAPQQRAYLESVLTGQMERSADWRFEAATRVGKYVEHGWRDKMLVKFCRLNRMLHWFAGSFDVRGIVFIIRHPCAVISSMLRWGEWSEDNLHGGTRRAQALHDGTLPAPLQDPFEPILERIETQVEVLATMWCLDHYVPLVHHAEQTGTHPWTLVSYERLLMHGRREVERLANIFGEAVTSKMVERLPEPSHSALEDRKRDEEEQLTKWTRHLSSQQIAEILDIVDDVGLSAIWTDDATPNYDRLNAMQRPAARW